MKKESPDILKNVSLMACPGERWTALAKVLQPPWILLLDEHTKGVDNDFKKMFVLVLKGLTDSTLVIVGRTMLFALPGFKLVCRSCGSMPEKLDRVKVKYGLIEK